MAAMWIAGLVVLAAGCGSYGLDAPYSDGEAAELRIDQVTPDWGPTSGGTPVALTGAGFVGDVALSFGGTPVDVTVVDAGTLVAVSPASSAEMTVDLTVGSDLGTFTLPDAFTYTDEGPPVDDTGGGGGGDASGKVSGLVELTYLAVACPACFNLTSNLYAFADAAFHEPVAGDWTSWMPAKGSCVSNPQATPLASTYEDVGTWVYLNSGSVSIAMKRQVDSSGATYLASDIRPSELLHSAAYDLQVADGGSWGPFTISDVLDTPGTISSIAPAAILGDGAQAFSARISASSATFGWSPTGVSDAVVVIIDVYNGTTGAYLGEVMCRGADNGSLTVPSGDLASYPAGSRLAIYLYRQQIGSGINPLDGSAVQSAVAYGALGTGVLTC